ncbi:MAG: hypothetical protein Roseis2KO_24910 [Roseivirga sp.]
MHKKALAVILAALFTFTACGSDDGGSTSIAPFSILNETTLVLNGVIDSNTDSAFDEALRQNPNTELIIFRDAPGSDDDETNLQVGRKLYQLGLKTHVDDNGTIASGAVDLYLAGSERTLGANARVGVHSWSDGTNDATDFPRNSGEHLPYINYYKSIGLSDQLAEDFYFFTINAASADDIHWMTASEIETYQIRK